jgi:outer membrane protein
MTGSHFTFPLGLPGNSGSRSAGRPRIAGLTVVTAMMALLVRCIGRGAARAARGNSAGTLIVVLCANLHLTAAALAQSPITVPPLPSLPFLPSPSGLWSVSIGAAGTYNPDFEGANGYKLSPSPIFSIHRAGSVNSFVSPRDGASFGLVDFDGFRAGPVGKLVPARRANSYPQLNGLGDVKLAIELGGFAEYFPTDWFRARAAVRQGFLGHDGVVADFSSDVIVPMLERLTVSAGPRFTLENTKATAPYFSINAVQGMASGLPVFAATGGSHSFGAGTQLRYQISPQWEAHSFVEYDRLLSGAAASPLVTLRGSPNQTTAGLGASYSFDLHMP